MLGLPQGNGHTEKELALSLLNNHCGILLASVEYASFYPLHCLLCTKETDALLRHCLHAIKKLRWGLLNVKLHTYTPNAAHL